MSIASNVGINKEIIDHKKMDFLVQKKKEWRLVFNEIINLKKSYGGIGNKARIKINNNYSYKSNSDKYLKFF